MTLRGRITLSAAIAVALAIVLASTVVYLATARTLQREVDRDLTSIANELRSGPANLIFQGIRRDGRRPGTQGQLSLDPRHDPFGGAVGYVQLLDSTGTVFLTTNSETVLPVTSDAAAVPLGRQETWETVTVDDRRIRVLTTPVGQAAALQVARPLDEVVSSLARLRRLLLAVGVVGIGAAAAIGWFVGRRAVRPVVALTDTAESVTATQDLSHRIDVDGNDELARLATTFNQMLASLEQARDAQDQLIADASHELRTPLTSLRTNIEVLSSGADLSAADRRGLAADVVAQLDEFGQLVTGLVELARGDTPVAAMVDVAVDEVASDVVARIRMHHPNAEIDLVTEPSTVRGDATRIDRAIGNLVSNAVVHGGSSPVTVTVGDATVTVRDRGPGIPEADLPHVTDRFHRSQEARSRPGSGLGLAIVDQAARAHGGRLSIHNHPDGGVEATLSLAPAG